MGGPEAIRGFLLQTIISVFGVLNSKSDWLSIQIEPDIKSEKVDILINYFNAEIEAIQVKSSQNQLSKSEVEKWSQELERSYKADNYKLILLGPCSRSVTEMGSYGSVKIPPPLNIDIEGWIFQASHQLDSFMIRNNMESFSPTAREIIVKALITNFETYSTQKKKVSKDEFEKMFRDWIEAFQKSNRLTTLAYEKVRKASLTIFEQWKNQHRYISTMFIELGLIKEAEKHEDKPERTDIKGICDFTNNDHNVLIKGLPGAGKTIILIQIADYLLKQNGWLLPILISLPEWATEEADLYAATEKLQAFRAENVTANELALLSKQKQIVFLLNGWNEIPSKKLEQATSRLSEAARSSLIITTTRERSILPPLNKPIIVYVPQINMKQRRLIIKKADIINSDELIKQIEHTPNLDEITRTPLLLSAVIAISQDVQKLPTTRFEIFDKSILFAEEKKEHKSILHGDPLFSSHRQYLTDIAFRMTENGGAALHKDQVLKSITSISKGRVNDGLISMCPEPERILDLLCNHHLLVRKDKVIHFAHQQFQEWFAAHLLYNELIELGDSPNPEKIFNFKVEIINKPIWEEALLFLSEYMSVLSKQSSSEKIVGLGSNLVLWAMDIDPLFCAQIANKCGEIIWNEIREPLCNLFRKLYSFPQKAYKEWALACIFASGYPDFSDIIWQLLGKNDQQERLWVYRISSSLPLSCLGSNWRERVNEWDESLRSEFISEIAMHPSAEGITLAEEFAKTDPSPKVCVAALQRLAWNRATDAIANILETSTDNVWQEAIKQNVFDLLPVSYLNKISERLKSIFYETSEPNSRYEILDILMKINDVNVVDLLKKEIEFQTEPVQLEKSIGYIYTKDAEWVGKWLVERLLKDEFPIKQWSLFIDKAPLDLLTDLLKKALDENEPFSVLQKRFSIISRLPQLGGVKHLIAKYFKQCQIIQNESYQEEILDIKLGIQNELSKLPWELIVEEIIQNFSKPKDYFELLWTLDLLLRTGDIDLRGNSQKSLPEEYRKKLLIHLKDWMNLSFVSPVDAGKLNADCVRLLARLGSFDEIELVAKLIDSEIERIKREDFACEKWKASRGKEPQPHGRTIWSHQYISALKRVGGQKSESILIRLLNTPAFEELAAFGLVQLLNEDDEKNIIQDLNNYNQVLAARQHLIKNEGKNVFPERQIKYAHVIKERIQSLLTEYPDSKKQKELAYRMMHLSTSLALIVSKEIIPFLIQIAKLGINERNIVHMFEILVVRGYILSGEDINDILEPIMSWAESEAKRSSDSSHFEYVVMQCLKILLCTDKPSLGFDRIIRLSDHIKYSYGLRNSNILDFIAMSKTQEAEKLLLSLGEDNKFLERFFGNLIKALAKLSSSNIKKKLLDLIEDNKWYKELHDFLYFVERDLTEYVIFEDNDFKYEIYSRCSKIMDPEQRELLGYILNIFGNDETALEGCHLLNDASRNPIPRGLHDLVMDKVIIEKEESEELTNAYYEVPRECNPLRERLFQLCLEDNMRRKSALLLLTAIENTRVELGRPKMENRHPNIQSQKPWPLINNDN